MSLTIQMSPDIEQRLALAAKAAGMSPDSYAARLIQQSLVPSQPQQVGNHRLPEGETALIQSINNSLSAIDWPYYQALITKRQDTTLTVEEHSILIDLSDQVEAANVDRLSAIAALAELRGTSIDAVMDDLELKPQRNV